MEKYKTELDDKYIAFSGTTDLITVNDYVRIDGPVIFNSESSTSAKVLI